MNPLPMDDLRWDDELLDVLGGRRPLPAGDTEGPGSFAGDAVARLLAGWVADIDTDAAAAAGALGRLQVVRAEAGQAVIDDITKAKGAPPRLVRTIHLGGSRFVAIVGAVLVLASAGVAAAVTGPHRPNAVSALRKSTPMPVIRMVGQTPRQALYQPGAAGLRSPSALLTVTGGRAPARPLWFVSDLGGLAGPLPSDALLPAAGLPAVGMSAVLLPAIGVVLPMVPLPPVVAAPLGHGAGLPGDPGVVDPAPSPAPQAPAGPSGQEPTPAVPSEPVSAPSGEEVAAPSQQPPVPPASDATAASPEATPAPSEPAPTAASPDPVPAAADTASKAEAAVSAETTAQGDPATALDPPGVGGHLLASAASSPDAPAQSRSAATQPEAPATTASE